MKEIKYIVEDSAKFVHNYISDELSNKYSYDDILDILEVEFEWQQENLINKIVDDSIDLPPFEIDEEGMMRFIINHCEAVDIFLTTEELDEILEGEMEYMQSIGLIIEPSEE